MDNQTLRAVFQFNYSETKVSEEKFTSFDFERIYENCFVRAGVKNQNYSPSSVLFSPESYIWFEKKVGEGFGKIQDQVVRNVYQQEYRVEGRVTYLLHSLVYILPVVPRNEIWVNNKNYPYNEGANVRIVICSEEMTPKFIQKVQRRIEDVVSGRDVGSLESLSTLPPISKEEVGVYRGEGDEEC